MSPPLVVNGWRIFVWRDFRERWIALRTHVEELRRRDPEGYRTTSAAKFLSTLRDLILKEIPSNPAAEAYRQDKSLGGANRNWQRAKFHRRFRLFFRFSSKHRVIIYAWLNNEDTLRKSGARTDPYVVFRAMLSRGEPPSNWDALLAECRVWTEADVKELRRDRALDTNVLSNAAKPGPDTAPDQWLAIAPSACLPYIPCNLAATELP